MLLTAHSYLVATYAKIMGSDNAEVVVGCLLIAILAIIIGVGVWIIFRELAMMGCKLFGVVLLIGAVLLLAGKLVALVEFVFPGDEAKQEIRETVTETSRRAWVWLRHTFSPL